MENDSLGNLKGIDVLVFGHYGTEYLYFRFDVMFKIYIKIWFDEFLVRFIILIYYKKARCVCIKLIWV